MPRYNTNVPDIVGAVSAIDRRTGKQARTPQLGNSSIDKGRLTVQNDGELRIVAPGRFTYDGASMMHALIGEAHSSVATAAIGTSDTGILTISDVTFLDTYAYKWNFRGQVISDTGARHMVGNIFKNSVAGSVIGTFGRVVTVSTSSGVEFFISGYIKNDTGADITADVVCSIRANAGTVTVEGLPYFFELYLVGDASDYGHAVDIT